MKTSILQAFAAVLITGMSCAYGAENASNPLAAVNNTDLRIQYFDLDGPERTDYWTDGAFMATPKLKLKYELHYWDTDVTGSSESDFESFHFKPMVLVPLVQHFVEYDGPEVNQTAFRLIAIQSLPADYWGKLDAIVPLDWENDNAVPATWEVQLGNMFSPSFGTYVDGLFGLGGDKPYEWGVGVGVRFNY